MKLKYIIASLLAGVTLFSACEKEADHYLSEIKVDKSFVGFPKEGGTQIIKLTTTANWTVEVDEDDEEWLLASPESGAAGTFDLTLATLPDDEGHETEIYVVCNGQKQIIKVTQEAGEKKETPITSIEEAIKLGEGTFRLQGIVTKVTSESYGNFYLADETGEILIYGVKDAKGYPKDDASGWARFGIDAGDNVIVEGPYKVYNGTSELVDAEVIKVTKSLISVEDFTFEKLPAIDTTFHMVVTAKESPLLLASDSEWLQVTSVGKDGSYILHADENLKTAERTATIAIQGPTAFKAVSIIQMGVKATGSSVSDVIKMDDDSQVELLPTSVVVALTTKGAVLSDGEKAIYAYGDAAAALKVGDGVRFGAKKTTFNGVPELTDVKDVFRDSEDNEVKYPEAEDITAKVADYTAAEAKYIKFSGTLSVSADGKYYNVTFDGVDSATKQGSIVYPVEDLKAASFDGKKITVTGFFNGLSGGGKFVNIIATKIVEYVDNPKGTLTNPYKVADIIAALKAGSVEGNVYVKGIISQTTKYNFVPGQYNTASFWISDDGVYNDNLDKDFEAFSCYWLGGSLDTPTAAADIKANFEIGDEVILYGAVTSYTKDEKTTYETDSKKAKIYSLNTATTDNNGVGNASYPFNVAGAEAYIDAKVAAMEAAGEDADKLKFPDVCVGGIVSAILYEFKADKETGAFWISDDGTAYGVSSDKKSTTEPTKDFECYGLYWGGPEQRWVEGDPQPAVGDKVIVKGQLTKYNTTYETSSKKAWVAEHIPAN